MRKILLYTGIIIVATALSATAGLQDGLIFYDDCNDLKSPYPDVKISSSIEVENGKFGKALRIERRTVNSQVNGDFKEKESDAWLYRDNAAWQAKGGIKDSSCLKITGGDVIVPMVELKPKSGNAFSFYAKNAQSGKEATVTMSYEAAGKVIELVKSVKLSDEYTRIQAPFVAASAEGSLCISASGEILIDNAQLDKGVTFFNTYNPPLKMRGVDRITIPADGKYYDAKSGTINCWVKGPWVDSDMIGSICSLFAVNNASEVKKWGSTSVMFISCIPIQYAGGAKGTLHFIAIDDKARVAGLSERDLTKLPPLSEDKWRMFSFTWVVKDEEIHQAMYVDGKKLFEKAIPFGPLKEPVSISIGSSGGSYLNGLLDDFAIYNRPLSPEEIMTIYNSGKPLIDIN